MNKINTYGHAIIHLGGTDVIAHVIAVNHVMCCGLLFYSSFKDTFQEVKKLHACLDKYAPLRLDSDFDFSEFAPGILEIYASDSIGLFSSLINHQIYKL